MKSASGVRFLVKYFFQKKSTQKNVEASLKDGILILRLPRIAGEKTKKVKLKKK